MTSTTHRMHLVLWAVSSMLLGVLSLLLARQASVCMVVRDDLSLAEQAPAAKWLFIAVGAIAFAVAVAFLNLARSRSNHAACPHCGKVVEPRVTVAGELKLVAPAPSAEPPP
ncbi:MAG TPA: hypothetical protein VFA20_12950 [Myxococcaceae bacterium]|nr:hypothetical protein [Myxococcaceae bacterium]